jgi:hypothetical protein
VVAIKKLLDDWKDVLSRYANITFLHKLYNLQFDNLLITIYFCDLTIEMQIVCQTKKRQHLPSGRYHL